MMRMARLVLILAQQVLALGGSTGAVVHRLIQKSFSEKSLESFQDPLLAIFRTSLTSHRRYEVHLFSE